METTEKSIAIYTCLLKIILSLSSSLSPPLFLHPHQIFGKKIEHNAKKKKKVIFDAILKSGYFWKCISSGYGTGGW